MLSHHRASQDRRLDLARSSRSTVERLALQVEDPTLAESKRVYPFDLNSNGTPDTYVFDRNGNGRIDAGEIVYDAREDRILDGLHPDSQYILRMGPVNYATRIKVLRSYVRSLEQLQESMTTLEKEIRELNVSLAR